MNAELHARARRVEGDAGELLRAVCEELELTGIHEGDAPADVRAAGDLATVAMLSAVEVMCLLEEPEAFAPLERFSVSEISMARRAIVNEGAARLDNAEADLERGWQIFWRRTAPTAADAPRELRERVSADFGLQLARIASGVARARSPRRQLAPVVRPRRRAQRTPATRRGPPVDDDPPRSSAALARSAR